MSGLIGCEASTMKPQNHDDPGLAEKLSREGMTDVQAWSLYQYKIKMKLWKRFVMRAIWRDE